MTIPAITPEERKELAQLVANCGASWYVEPFQRLEVALSAAEARIERLEAALRPFAECCEGLTYQNDDMNILVGPNQYDMRTGFLLGDLRRARAALDGETK